MDRYPGDSPPYFTAFCPEYKGGSVEINRHQTAFLQFSVDHSIAQWDSNFFHDGPLHGAGTHFRVESSGGKMCLRVSGPCEGELFEEFPGDFFNRGFFQGVKMHGCVETIAEFWCEYARDGFRRAAFRAVLRCKSYFASADPALVVMMMTA